MTRGISPYRFQPIIEPSVRPVQPWRPRGSGQPRLEYKYPLSHAMESSNFTVSIWSFQISTFSCCRRVENPVFYLNSPLIQFFKMSTILNQLEMANGKCGRVDRIIRFNSLRQNPWSWFNSLRNSQVKILSFCQFKIVKVGPSITGLDSGAMVLG